MEITLGAGAEPVPGYRLVERLGRGGCGEVWKATGPGGFELALKFVCLAESIGPLELRGLQIIKDIRHPHLLATFGAWQVGSYLIIAMELAERTLLDRFREAAGQGFPGIPAPEIHEHFLDAARGLDYLNEPRHPSEGAEPVGIQHRDVKPQNLLLVGGSVKVADFGLARILEHTQTSHTGSMTPAYAAPEFFKKQTFSQSDQYSLAVTYCQLRGGRLPFTGGMAEVMAGHLLEPPDLTMLPEGEREAAARALAKEPRDRWESCRAFVEALSSGVPTQDRVAPTTGPVGPSAWGTFRPGEAGGASSSAGPESSASPGRPAPVSPPAHWGARPEVHPRRSLTAMSDRGRKVLALSLTTLSSSLVIVLGLWGLGMFTPRSDQEFRTDVHWIASPSDTKPGDSITNATPEPHHPMLVATGPKSTSALKRAPTLVLDVEKSKRGIAETKPGEETKAEPSPPPPPRRGELPKPKVEPRPAEDTMVPIEGGSDSSKTAQAHLDRGRAYEKKGDLDRAIADYAAALQLDPKLAIAYFCRGFVYGMKGDLDRAIADYNDAIQCDPTFAVAYYNRGIAYDKKGDLNYRAIIDFNQAISLGLVDAKIYCDRGIAYGKAGYLTYAIADFNEAIRLDPKLVRAYVNRGLAHTRTGDSGRAIADCNEAIRLDPKYVWAYYNRGGAFSSKGNFDRAIADYDEAIRLDPKFARAYYDRGITYKRMGDISRATTDINEARRLDPHYVEIMLKAPRKMDAERKALKKGNK